ncbi:hypothetical protein [Nocardia sp. NPDC059239]|uniref:hypothetical protein n=1 Tax=unclassified Nocardia TaxID=2637762 RepID=UPI0036876E9A
MRNTLPIHPHTGLRAIGWTRRGPIWPILGGSEDGGHPALEGAGAGADADSGETAPKPTETVDFWKSKSRDWEKRAKDNAGAAKELADIKDAQKTEAERAADKLTAAQAEVDSIPSKVADALREHLVTLHKIPEDQAELYLTASNPELLLKQVAGLVDMGARKSNRVPREGRNPKAADDEMAAFTRQVFGNSE